MDQIIQDAPLQIQHSPENITQFSVSVYVGDNVFHVVMTDMTGQNSKTLTNCVEAAVLAAWRAVPEDTRNYAEKTRANVFFYQHDEDGYYMLKFHGRMSQLAVTPMRVSSPQWMYMSLSDMNKILGLDSHSAAE